MCDEAKLHEWASAQLSRRRFGALAGAAAVVACAPSETGSQALAQAGEAASETVPLAEASVTFETGDGTMDAFFVHPAEGKHPGVIFWPDIASLREAKRAMARRLAGEGYAVLVLNPYYRDVAGEQFADFVAFIQNEGFKKVGPWRARLNADAIGRDASAAVAWLDQQPAVDTAKGIGTQGYCMGGPFTVWSAAAEPERIGVLASFHGGGLVTDDPKSPHRMISKAKAYANIYIAQNDDAKAPEDKITFQQAVEAAPNVDGTYQVIEADHGWAVPDSPVHDKRRADMVHQDLIASFRTHL